MAPTKITSNYSYDQTQEKKIGKYLVKQYGGRYEVTDINPVDLIYYHKADTVLFIHMSAPTEIQLSAEANQIFEHSTA